MNKYFLWLILIGLAGCGAAKPPKPTAPTSSPTPSPETILPVDNGLTPEAYPALPTNTPLPADYPAPVATPDPYPAAGEDGFVWIIKPVGIQCEDLGDATETGLRAALEALTAVGVSIIASEMVNLPVTAVCGSPTSAHYRVQIPASDLPKAQVLSWFLSQ